MQKQEILPVLYDLSITIGAEVKLSSLLSRTLQRLLYHTSFSAGFVCLDLPPADTTQAVQQVRLAAAVGDYDLVTLVNQPYALPNALLYGNPQTFSDQAELLSQLATTHSRYQSYLRLPLENNGVIVLLAMTLPETNLNLALILQPVLAQFAKAIVLCRTHDAQLAQAQQRQVQLQRSLTQIEEQYQALIELSPIGVGLSRDGIMLEANDAFVQLFGFDSMYELRDRSLLELIAPQCQEEVKHRVQQRARGMSVASSYEIVGLRKNGTQFPLLVSAKRVAIERGAITFAFFIDLSEQKHAEQQLRASHDMLRQVLESVPVRVFWKDQASRYLGCNQAFARDAGCAHPDDLVGKDDTQMGWAAQAVLYQEDDRRVMAENKSKLNYEEPQTTPDGQTIWLRTSKVPLHNATGQVTGLLGIYDDITEQKRIEAQIHQLEYFDVLTQLPNRRLMYDRLKQALAVSTRNHQYGAVIFLDLDDFKTLNETQGHKVGDQLLCEVGKRLQACVREEETVARLGGDEFVVILENLGTQQPEAATHTELVTEKIRMALSQPYHFVDAEVSVTPSIGMVLFQDHLDDINSLLQHADTAMYQAKQAGRNTSRFFDPQIQAELENRQQLVDDLRLAIERNQLQLYFQPQVDSENRILGAEVLLRWRHPQRGLVPPAQFIPVAEQTGLILPIGLWVLREACVQLRRWQASAGMRDLSLAVNVSVKQFQQANFLEQVQRILVETEAKPSHLKLELTESMMLENVEDIIAKMREIKMLGVSFSMDDFGTGYSSLQYLKRLPLDQIKIDQSFVRDIITDPNDAAIVQTIIAMTEAMGLNVIAEGVETETQREFLNSRGCHTFQGYLFSKPLPLEQFMGLFPKKSA